MKIGILIIFHNDETQIEVQKFIELFTDRKKLSICLVNNSSTDHTFELLEEIKEEATIPISLIDIKKKRDHHVAIKAGVRYLTSKNDLPYILCLQNFTSKDFLMLEKGIRIIQQEKEIVQGLFSKAKQLTHKNVFSLHEILEKAS